MKLRLFALLLLTPLSLLAQKKYAKALASIDAKAEAYTDVAQQIWSWAELGYQEEKSSALLQSTLEDAGFTIEKGVAGIPTAFVATYDSGSPVIGIMGEYDALPGISQSAVPYKTPSETSSGHACGHHLFGTASSAAAIAVKEHLAEKGKGGTIVFFGCPAEEGGSGKVYMTRAGLFDAVDVMLHWHPSSINAANPANALANKSAKFRFYGTSAHAAGAPEKGRSALDAVESMNYMVNQMREHVPSDSRIHYVITSGGEAPNVVPNYAEVYYYTRHPKRDVVMDLFDRVVNAAKGAALGTDTKVDYEIIGGVHELLPNETLQTLVHKNLSAIGGYAYTSSEKEFATQISESLGRPLNTQYVEGVMPYTPNTPAGGSTDVGDVSFTVPTVGFGAATWVPGTPAHSWQAVAAGGTSIGTKGMVVAAKTLALTALQLLNSPKLIQQAKEEFETQRGANFKYIPLIGNRAPALDYRN